WLEKLNQSHVLAQAGAVPNALKDSIDPDTYAKSVEYTLAKSRFGTWENTWNTVVLLLTDRFHGTDNSSHGWQQTVAPFERVLHRLRPVPENRSVRHPDSTIGSGGIGSGALPRDRDLT